MLHIYAKSILKQNMAFGDLVEQSGYDNQDRNLVHESKRNDKHWTSLAEYADFLQDFKNSFASFAEEHNRLNNPYVDVAEMMVKLG